MFRVFGGPNSKDYNIMGSTWGSILGSPYFGNLPYAELAGHSRAPSNGGRLARAVCPLNEDTGELKKQVASLNRMLNNGSVA